MLEFDADTELGAVELVLTETLVLAQALVLHVPIA
jgi:hypothetical protein